MLSPFAPLLPIFGLVVIVQLKVSSLSLIVTDNDARLTLTPVVPSPGLGLLIVGAVLASVVKVKDEFVQLVPSVQFTLQVQTVE